MAPSLDRWNVYSAEKDRTVGAGGPMIILLLGVAAFGLLLFVLGMTEFAKTLWPLWTASTAFGLAYLAWQTDHWPGVRESRLGLEASMGGAVLGVLSLAVFGVVNAGLMHASNFFLIRFGAILFVGAILGGALYFWFYLFTTKSRKRTAETLRILSIGVLGIGLWSPIFFADLGIVFAIAHFMVAIWAGVIASGQAVAEDSVTRQLSD